MHHQWRFDTVSYPPPQCIKALYTDNTKDIEGIEVVYLILKGITSFTLYEAFRSAKGSKENSPDLKIRCFM